MKPTSFLLALALFNGVGVAAPRPAEHFTTLTDDGGWCWFSDPRAVSLNGNTYTGWVTEDGSIEAAKINHASGKVTTVVLHAKYERDDHDNPAFLFLPDGRLMAFYSKHGGGARPGIQSRVTRRPGVFTEWEPEVTLPLRDNTGGHAGISYCNPFLLTEEDNTLYLFWRGLSFKPTMAKSTDEGKSWSTAQPVFSRPGLPAGNRPYAKYASNGKDRIHFLFTDGHPRNEPFNSVYYICYRAGAFYKADGTRICGVDELPIRPEQADLIHDATTTGVRAWIWGVAFDRKDQPVVAYTRLPLETDHRYHYARWDGQTWFDTELCAGGGWFPQTVEGKAESEPHYSSGLALDPSDPSIVYLTRPVKGVRELEQWITRDGGKSWKSEAVTRGSLHDNIRPYVVVNHAPDGPTVLWQNLSGRYVHYTNYRSSIKADRPVHSQLWGASGEAWSPHSRLPDFSHAGYHRGEQPLPTVPRGVSVQDFGAQGDGVTDDTKAFLAAIEKVERGAIEVPPGRYRISSLLEITRPGVVLRGAGPDSSVLVCPTPLNDIKPNWGATTSGQRTSNYSWSGGFLVVRGTFGSQVLADVSHIASRGENTVTVVSPVKLRVGQEVEVYQSDLPDNSLAIHLYSGDAGPVQNLKGRARTSLIARITGIEGNRVTLDRSLRSDLRLEWKPRLRAFEPTVTESGVENLGFEFPVTPYKGHFTELGFNPIALSGVAHCWVRNIRVRHADSGPYVSGAFNTVEGVVLESERPVDNQKCTGHHGISLGGTDNLVENFEIRTRFIHDLTVSGYCSGNVFARGRGADLSLDHHRYAPNENLFTDLDAGAGTRLWKCGGGAALGKHCGARGTFWNIRAANPLSYPPSGFGPPTMNLVALETRQASETAMEGKWFEAIPPNAIQPRNLHAAQLERRLNGK